MINNNNRKILSILALLLLTFVLVGVVSATDTTTNDTTSVVKDTQANDYSNDVQVTDNAKSIQKTDKTPAIKMGVQTLTANDYTELKTHVRTAMMDTNDDEYTISLVQGNQYVIDETIQWMSLSASIPLNIEGNGATITGGGQHSFLTIKEGYSVNINNIIIDSTSSDNGGAINNSGTLTLTNSAITNSKATNGGAIYSTGTVNLENVTLQANEATKKGGAIYSTGTINAKNVTFKDNVVTAGVHSNRDGGAGIYTTGAIYIDNSTFDSNIGQYTDSSSSSNGADGGAIRVCDSISDMIINNTIFTNNKGRHGGALLICDDEGRNLGTKKITDSTFTGNQAIYGGAIEVYNDLIIENCVFEENSVKGIGSGNRNPLGGAICVNDLVDSGTPGSLSVKNTTFEKNTASTTQDSATTNYGYGGAIYNSGPESVIENCTFTENEAYSGGAIDDEGISSTIEDSVFDKNTAIDCGGAVFTINNGTGTTTNLNNCNFTENSAENGGAVAIIGNVTINIDECSFDQNTANSYGGAYYSEWNLPNTSRLFKHASITNSNFTNNTAGNYPAIYDTNSGAWNGGSSSTVIDNCNFENNTATDASGSTIYTRYASASITNSNISDTNDRAIAYVWSNGVANLENDIINGIEVESTYNGELEVSVSNYAELVALTNVLNNQFGGDPVYVNFTGDAVYTETEALVYENNTCQVTFIGNGRTIDADGMQFLTIANGKKLTINNLTIANANAEKGAAIINHGTLTVNNAAKFENNTASVNGGAIYSDGTLNVYRTNFTNNNATNYGGAIYLEKNTKSNLTVGYSCNFTDNNASVGGAIFANLDSKITMTSTTSTEPFTADFTNNKAKTGSTTGDGGAIYANNATINVQKASFTDNCADVNGGALCIYNSTSVTIKNSNFTDNVAGDNGGALWTTSSTTINNSKFEGNTAENMGGAIYNNKATLYVNNTNFTDNKVTSIFGEGGAVYDYDGIITLNNSRFDGNSANDGGAFFTSHAGMGGVGSVTLENDTFTENTAENNGGAVFTDNPITITKTAFEDNQAENGGAVYTGFAFEAYEVAITESSFDSNNATNGGAIYASFETTITDSNFTENTATNGGAVYLTPDTFAQYGLSESQAEASVSGSRFIDNVATENGDMIYVANDTEFEITGSTINTDDENTLVYVDGDSVITARSNTVNNVPVSEGLVQTSINAIDSIVIPATVDTNITVVVVTNKNDTVTSGNVQVFVGNELIPTESNPTEDGFIVTLRYDTIGDEQVTIKYSDDTGVFVDSQTTTTLSVGAIPTTIDTIENVTVTIYDQTTVLVVVRDANDNIITSGNVLIVIGDEVISQNVEPTDDGFIVTIECSAIGEYVAKVNYVADDEVAMYDNSNTEFNITINPIVTSIDDIANQTVTLNHDGTVLVVVKDDNGDVVTDGDVNITIDDVNIVESIESSDDGFTVTINTDKLGDNVASVSFSDASGVYANATTTFNLTVNPMTTSIDELSPLSVVVTSNVQVLVVVRDMDGNILTTGSVKVYKSGNETELSTACVSDNEGFTVTIHGDKVGNYALDVVYVPAEDVYSSSQTQTTLDVKVFDTYIEDITPITTVANTDFTVSVKVVPSEVMTKGTVKLFIGETELDSSRYVVGDESYDITTSTDIAGDNTLTVKFISDDENYADCEITTDISVAKIDTVTTMAPLEAVVNETVTLTANVTGVNGEVINTGKVSFKVNGKTLRDTDGRILYALVVNGTASTDVTALESWTKTDSTIEAIYSGSNVTTSSKSGKVDLSVSNPPVPEEAKIEIGELDEASPGDNVTIKVTATGVSGGKVILKVNGKTVKNADGKLYAKLDENGVATFTYYVPKTAKDGNYTVKAVYTDSVYKLYDEETLIVSS
ncbi:MAG: hypothetical protein BZ136_06645 [Methanosphaera sp. rholeuAM74]|nr:MAG: hypothetical protein BZ136_06645 [Methanosphaera sp. rholeuAM74]